MLFIFNELNAKLKITTTLSTPEPILLLQYLAQCEDRIGLPSMGEALRPGREGAIRPSRFAKCRAGKIGAGLLKNIVAFKLLIF